MEILPIFIGRLQWKAGRLFLKTTSFLLLKPKKTAFLLEKWLEGKNEQVFGKCDLTSRLLLVAPLYHQTETIGIMKTIQTIIEAVATILGLQSTKQEPQLLAVTQESFCENMVITDYYCDENNLFI